jgi:EmrB/QacA subfamily drug resistance transporter
LRIASNQEKERTIEMATGILDREERERVSMQPSSVSRGLLAQPHERARTGRQWIVLLLVCMATLLDALDTGIVNVALPSIQHDLHLSTLDLPWIQGAYVLTFGGFLLLGGRSADLFGRRRIFLLGTGLFGLASFLCGLSSSGWLLILARGVQGIGAAMTVPSALSILTTTFAEGPRRNQAMGIYVAISASGFSFGLILGGLLTTFLSWHWVFYVNLPFAMLILLLGPMMIQESRSRLRSRSYDLAGAVTVTAGVLLLVYAITQSTQAGATLWRTIGLFAASLLLLAVFVLIEWRAKAPLIPLRIFRSRTTTAANLGSFALLGAFFSFLLIVTLYLQDVLHASPLLASLALLPAGLASLPVCALLTPRLVNRLGMKLSAGLGLLCLAIGIALFMRIGPSSDYVGVILLPMLVTITLGMSIGFPSLAIAAVSGIANSEQGLAAGLQSAAMQVGGGLWLAITTAVAVGSSAQTQAVASQAGAITVQAQLTGFHLGLLVAALVAAAGALIVLLGIQHPPAPAPQVSEEEEAVAQS